MGRPKLNMTPEERKLRDTKGATLRKQKQRSKEYAAQQLEGQLSKDELDELIDMLCGMSLYKASLTLAEVQRNYKKQYGMEIPGLREASFAGDKLEGETQEEYTYRRSRAQTLGLIRMFAIRSIQRLKANARNKKYELKEKDEAAKLGLNIQTYKQQKRALKITIKAKATVTPSSL